MSADPEGRLGYCVPYFPHARDRIDCVNLTSRHSCRVRRTLRERDTRVRHSREPPRIATYPSFSRKVHPEGPALRG